ncbi:hypothetical protein ABW20_dc0105144 [Dactylellina cionopaga]|nr:hypothetical protein ABW20_dc0105144 [Dactylellina cionopaga]
MDQLPGHVRDSIAAILAPELPAKLPSLGSLTDHKADASGSTGAIHSLIDLGAQELWTMQEYFSIRPPSAFTLPRHYLLVMAQLENIILARTEERARGLYARLTAQKATGFPTTAEPDERITKSASNFILPRAPPPFDEVDPVHPTRENTPLFRSTPTIAFGLDPKTGIYFEKKQIRGGLFKRSIDTIHVHAIQNDGLPNVFKELRMQVDYLGDVVAMGIRKARLKCLASYSLGGLATFLIIGNGFDPLLGLSILFVIVLVARRRFERAFNREWKIYQENSRRLGHDCLSTLSYFFTEYAKGENGSRPKDIELYNNKQDELEEVNRELAEARKLLLEMAPTLKAKFPQWLRPESKANTNQGKRQDTK